MNESLEQRYPQRAQRWRLRTRELQFLGRPLLMGILNVTPDSFSDGGHFFDPRQAIEQGLKLIREGADILDVGGESTRPYSIPVPLDEELRRVVPVVRALCASSQIPVSIDTSKAAVARAALEAGAEIINDITGLEGDPDMVATAREFAAGVCAMHMQGTPQTMQDNPQYEDVVQNIHEYLRQRRDALIAEGISSDRICLDPGIGFGKTHQHNVSLVAHCGWFHTLGHPLLVGHSRKGFIGKVIGDRDRDRMAGTIGVAMALAQQGIQILRVHDVEPVRDALLLFEATGGIDGREIALS